MKVLLGVSSEVRGNRPPRQGRIKPAAPAPEGDREVDQRMAGVVSAVTGRLATTDATFEKAAPNQLLEEGEALLNALASTQKGSGRGSLVHVYHLQN